MTASLSPSAGNWSRQWVPRRATRLILCAVFALFCLGKLPALYFGDSISLTLPFFALEGLVAIGLASKRVGRSSFFIAIALLCAFACVSAARAVLGWGCECFGRFEIPQWPLAVACACVLMFAWMSESTHMRIRALRGYALCGLSLSFIVLALTFTQELSRASPGAASHAALMDAVQSQAHVELSQFRTVTFVQHGCDHCREHLMRLANEATLNPGTAERHAIVEIPPYANDFDRHLLFPKGIRTYQADVADLLPCLPFQVSQMEGAIEGGCL